MSIKKNKNEEISVEVKKTEEEAKVEALQDEKAHEPIIYVGPSIPGQSIKKYALYSNGVPTHITSHFENCKEFEKLFIPVGRLSTAEQELKDPTSPLSVFYKESATYFGKGKK